MVISKLYVGGEVVLACGKVENPGLDTEMNIKNKEQNKKIN